MCVQVRTVTVRIVDEAFRLAHRQGEARWAPVQISLERFTDLCVQANLSEDALRSRPEALYLAYAAGTGADGAHAALEREFLSGLSARLRRLGVTPDLMPDVLQTIRERLLLGPRPRILTYDGRASLQSWIKVIAMRLAIDIVRSRSAVTRIDTSFAAEPSAPPRDAATLLAAAQYRVQLETALKEELGRLPPDRRSVLRLHLLENESIDSIARRLGVHRVTVARWLWSLGEQVLENLRRRFHDDFGVVAPDFDSLVRLLRSTMNVDLRDLLGGP